MMSKYLARVFVSGAIGSAIAVGSALALLLPQGTLLRRELREGAVDAYKFEMKGNQSTPMGDMGIRSMMRYTLKVGAPEADGARSKCELIVSDMKVELEGGVAGMMPPPELPKEVVLKGTIDKLNRIVVDSSALLNPQLAMLGAGMSGPTGIFVAFPEQAVSTGDSWEVALPKNPYFGNQEPKLRATFGGQKAVEGLGQVYELTINGDIPISLDMQELMKSMPDNAAAQMFGDMKVVVTGKMGTKTTCWVEPSTGRILKMRMDSDIKQTVNIVDMSMAIDTSGTMTATMELERPSGGADKR